jgi:DNA-directed RNA polymerase specialized sigma24 family protein
MTRSKQDRQEIASGTGYSADRTRGPSLVDTHGLYDAHRPPENEYQSLMEADFGQEPVDPFPQETLITDAMAALTPIEAAVVSFIVFGGMSLREAGRYLGAEFPRNGVPTPYSKMGVSDIYKRALRKMRATLGEDFGNES